MHCIEWLLMVNGLYECVGRVICASPAVGGKQALFTCPIFYLLWDLFRHLTRIDHGDNSCLGW